MRMNWETRNIRIPYVQYLPNNFYMFFFEQEAHAQMVISHGTWLVRNTPFVFTRWTKQFDPKIKKPTTIPVWVDLVDLTLVFYPWVKDIGKR